MRIQKLLGLVMALCCMVPATVFCADTQTISLEAGWNWIGFNVLPATKTVTKALGNAGFTKNDIFYSSSTHSNFTGTKWLPSTTAVAFGKMYQIYVAQDNEVTVTGTVSSQTTVTLAAGWNWISNPTRSSISPNDLTFSGGFKANDRIQSATGQVIYSGKKWFPSSGFMLEPGKGYQMYTAASGTLTFKASQEDDDKTYIVIDLSGGPNAATYPVRYSSTGPDVTKNTCRTTELWLRRIPAGVFTMGSPTQENVHWEDEVQHKVTLTHDVYLGVFECTQKQWELVIGDRPSTFWLDECYATRPVENISYDMIRGDDPKGGAGWPTYGHTVDSWSFMGILQAKTGLNFDLPTEAIWEYACRAGTTTALNSGKNLINAWGNDVNLNEVARNWFNCNLSEYDLEKEEDYWADYPDSYGTAKVGSYKPNAWGLYDMHGNVLEWCLDKIFYDTVYSSSTSAPATDPVGVVNGDHCILRGGSWNDYPANCRSAARSWDGSAYTTAPSLTPDAPDQSGVYGFRVALWPLGD